MAGSVVSILQGSRDVVLQGSSKTRWNLDRGAFEALLIALDPDRERASNKYTALHDRLVRFFQWNNIEDADRLADETLDRLARRIAADRNNPNGSATDAVKEPEKFATGIARLLLHEYWRQQQRHEHALQAMKQQDWTTGEVSGHETEVLAAVLDECLSTLPPVQRELIEKYYGTEGRNQIESRKQLASQHNISLNALRNRAMRIRADLEERAARALRK